MAEPTPGGPVTNEVAADDPADHGTPVRRRGTTRLSRLSAVLAWVVGVWFLLFGFPGGYLPLVVAGLVLIWLGVGAWKGRRNRTVALAVASAIGAIYYPAAAWWRWTHADELRDISYPGLWAAMLAVQSAVLVAIAITATLSLRRPDHSGAPQA